jgi:hypothetical protein
MSPEKPKIVRLAILGVALPVAFGVMIELACDLLKQVVRYFSANIYFEIQNNIWEEVKDSDTWLGLIFAIILVILSTWVLDNWRWAHPRREVRTGLLLISIILTAIVDPPGHIFKDELLNAYGKAYRGEPMADVLKPFEHESPSLVLPHKEKGDQLDCIGDCWLRLVYEVPEMFGQRSISLDFDRDQKLLKKTS